MGAQSEGNSPSKASTGPGCRHFCDSASNKSVSLHRVQEAFGISILSVFKDRLILAPQQSPRLHSRRAPPAGCRAEAAQGTVPAEDAVSQRRVQMDTGSKSAVWRWVVEEWTARVCVTDVRFHEVSCHTVEKVAELSEKTRGVCSDRVK